jgi:putative dimethyl sulfoxide reductase chaperone
MIETATHAQAQIFEQNMQAPQMARADCCKLLAACFYPPDEDLFLKEAVTEKLRALLKIACPSAMPLIPPAFEYFKGDANVALAVAYTHLFLGPPGILAPPYASFYLDKNCEVMGPSTVNITKLYNRAGLGLDSDFNEMPDHIAVMLEFLYFLFFQEAVAGTETNAERQKHLADTRRNFLHDYMFTWIPAFCRKIRDAEEHPFYGGLADTLEVFVMSGLKEGP